MIEESWTPLLPRLEEDLRARASGNLSRKDDEAWAAAVSLLRVYRRILPRTHSGLAPEEVDEIVQDVLFKLQSLQTLHRLRTSRSPAGYIAVIVRNAATDFVRRRRRELELELPLTEDFPARGESEGDFAIPKRSVRLREALQSLRPEDQNLLKLRFWQGLSIAQIAETLGTTYSATAVRLFRILRKLREKIGSDL